MRPLTTAHAGDDRFVITLGPDRSAVPSWVMYPVGVKNLTSVRFTRVRISCGLFVVDRLVGPVALPFRTSIRTKRGTTRCW